MADYSLREVFKQFGKKIFGSCVNSCVSESQNLPLAASQGKVLQDQITQLNSNINFSYLIKKAKFLQPKSDLNNITASGIYYLNSSPEWLNVPISRVTNCYLIVFALNAKRCTQIILPGNSEYIYYRSTFTDQQLWQKWKQAGAII